MRGNPFVLVCIRCGWDWIRRGQCAPVHCPRCNSPYWNTYTTKQRYARHRNKFVREKRRVL